MGSNRFPGCILLGCGTAAQRENHSREVHKVRGFVLVFEQQRREFVQAAPPRVPLVGRFG